LRRSSLVSLRRVKGLGCCTYVTPLNRAILSSQILTRPQPICIARMSLPIDRVHYLTRRTDAHSLRHDACHLVVTPEGGDRGEGGLKERVRWADIEEDVVGRGEQAGRYVQDKGLKGYRFRLGNYALRIPLEMTMGSVHSCPESSDKDMPWHCERTSWSGLV